MWFYPRRMKKQIFTFHHYQRTFVQKMSSSAHIVAFSAQNVFAINRPGSKLSSLSGAREESTNRINTDAMYSEI